MPARASKIATDLLGGGWSASGSLESLRASLSPQASWALEGVADVRDLWLAEIAWWRRLRTDARVGRPALGGWGCGCSTDLPARSRTTTATRRGAAGTAFAPLMDTYGTFPYRDLDLTIPAGLAYALMFGAMFGDVSPR